ncbi:MAG: aminoglycoside phosphotransferase family protein [Actinomycetota bacterium]|nr:aminoglycoside phosphotransferase family protein [Actinomycetota bacterium]
MRPAVAAWVRAVLGPVNLLTDHSRHVGRVVEVADDRGVPWVVKTVPTATMFGNEVRAYTHWVPRFADQAPALRDAHPDLRTLILQRLPGRTEWSFDVPVHREAGRLLARIHGAASPQADGPGLAEASSDLLDRALRRLPDRTLLGRRELAFVAASIELLPGHAALPRVPCHGDYGGHNWLRGAGPMRVIDFSGAGWNPAAADFARLFIGPWWERPDLSDAFFDGYGRELTEAERDATRLQLPVLALMVLSHGHRRGNPTMARRGHRRLAALMAGRSFARRAPWARRLARQALRI